MQTRSVHLFGNDEDKVASLFYPRHRIKKVEYGAWDILLRFDCLESRMHEVLDEWLSSDGKVQQAGRVFLASERSPASFIELRFLPLVHALEILTQKPSIRTTIVDEEIYESLRKRMLGAIDETIPGELVDSIKVGLGYANGRNLKRKIASLLAEVSSDTWELFCVEPEGFVKGVVNTRNYHTHYSADRKQKRLRGEQLHWAIYKLSLMLRVLVLMGIGVPEDVLREAISKNHRIENSRKIWRNMSEVGSSGDVDDWDK